MSMRNACAVVLERDIRGESEMECWCERQDCKKRQYWILRSMPLYNTFHVKEEVGSGNNWDEYNLAITQMEAVLSCLQIHYISTVTASPIMSCPDQSILRTNPHHWIPHPFPGSQTWTLTHATQKPPHPMHADSILLLARASARLLPEPRYSTAQACKVPHRRTARLLCQCNQVA
jgi:hypothetical protein